MLVFLYEKMVVILYYGPNLNGRGKVSKTFYSEFDSHWDHKKYPRIV